jgi:glutaminase
MECGQLLNEIYDELINTPVTGNVAGYIPELAKIDPEKYGIHLSTIQGEHFFVGDSNEKFSIQSIAKVFALTLAFQFEKEKLWKRVGVEPSGSAFNSLVQLEYENGKPRNPLINSGAIVIADILLNHLPDAKNDFINFLRTISGHQQIDYNLKVYQSEKQTGFKNYAQANLMKSFGNIHNEIEKVMDFYFLMCSVEMSCRELADAFLLYANHGKLVQNNEEIITTSQCKRINAIMQTCGFYDEAGDFSFRVGLPGKSGVGGGIAAVYPGNYSVAVWSPVLNSKGNSVRGIKTLELLTTKTGSSIF